MAIAVAVSHRGSFLAVMAVATRVAGVRRSAPGAMMTTVVTAVRTASAADTVAIVMSAVMTVAAAVTITVTTDVVVATTTAVMAVVTTAVEVAVAMTAVMRRSGVTRRSVRASVRNASIVARTTRMSRPISI
ncbi:hypothetical protein HMPREF2748_02540 [Corynebacterium sp. HMSC077B05]|nr:hypothetical protein HMPREF2748_02540 [Corynebacterium sp. HMSC077B05]